MGGTFWSNTIWFVLLGLSTILELVIILLKSKDIKTTAALYIIVSGITFTLEVTIYCFFKSYDYFPMLFPGSPIDDGLAGNLFSQFSVTASALLIVTLNLKLYWNFTFAAVYFFIEELFIRLGVYKHNIWYRSWMTVIGFLAISAIMKLLSSTTFMYRSKLARYVLVSFGLYTLHMPTVLWIQILNRVIVLNLDLFSDAMNSYAFICLVNLVLISIVCMFAYFAKIDWRWKGLIVLSLYGALYLAEKINWIAIRQGWFLIFSTLDIGFMFLFIYILDRIIPEYNINGV